MQRVIASWESENVITSGEADRLKPVLSWQNLIGSGWPGIRFGLPELVLA